MPPLGAGVEGVSCRPSGVCCAPMGAFFRGPARLGNTKTSSGRSLSGFGDQTNKNFNWDGTMMNDRASVNLSLLTYL